MFMVPKKQLPSTAQKSVSFYFGNRISEQVTVLDPYNHATLLYTDQCPGTIAVDILKYSEKNLVTELQSLLLTVHIWGYWDSCQSWSAYPQRIFLLSYTYHHYYQYSYQ